MYKNFLDSDNYIKFLSDNTKLDRLKIIQLGYDLQCGNYEKIYKKPTQKRIELDNGRLPLLIGIINNILKKKIHVQYWKLV